MLMAKGSEKKEVKAFEWIEYSPKEIEDLIIQLVNSGNAKSEIGMLLRDQYGIPDVRRFLGKSITEVLKESGLAEEIPEDLMNLIKTSVMIEKHFGKNKKDFTAKHGYTLCVSKINRLVKYYRKKKKLPKDWKFTAETARLLVK